MINNIIDSKYSIYLIASIIPLMSVSIFLADFIVTLYSIIFLAFFFGNSKKINLNNTFLLLSLVLYITSIASSLFSDHQLFSLKSSVFFIRIIIFIVLLSFFLEKKKNFSNTLYIFFKFTFLILILYGILSYVLEYFYLYNSDQLNISNIRLKLAFSDEQKLGSYLIRFYGLFLALFLIQKNKYKYENITFTILTIFCFLVIFLSGERTASFFLILSIFLSFVFLQFQTRIKLFLVSTIFIFFGIILIFNQNLTNRIFLDKFNQLNLDSKNLVIFTPQYTAHYKTAYKIFLDKPFIGHGPKIFRKICSKKEFVSFFKTEAYDDQLNEDVINIYSGCANHPHNTYMQLLSETGIIGFIIFFFGFLHISLLFFKEFFKIVFRKKRNLSNYQIAVGISVIIVFWPFSPSGNFFNNWVSIMNAFPLGFYVHAYFLKRNT